MRRLILGIGNTIMGDDRVGIYVAHTFGENPSGRVQDAAIELADMIVREMGQTG